MLSYYLEYYVCMMLCVCKLVNILIPNIPIVTINKLLIYFTKLQCLDMCILNTTNE